MKIENQVFIFNPQSIKYRTHDTSVETVRATYTGAGGLLEHSFMTYDRAGRIIGESEQKRKVSTKGSWDIKI